MKLLIIGKNGKTPENWVEAGKTEDLDARDMASCQTDGIEKAGG